jgi:hypothetical protein
MSDWIPCIPLQASLYSPPHDVLLPQYLRAVRRDGLVRLGAAVPGRLRSEAPHGERLRPHWEACRLERQPHTRPVEGDPNGSPFFVPARSNDSRTKVMLSVITI